MPITDDHNEYATLLQKRLRASSIRAKADLSSDRMNAKIRAAQLMQVPYQLVLGDREVENETISIRKRDNSRQNGVPVAEFIAAIKENIASRSPEL